MARRLKIQKELLTNYLTTVVQDLNDANPQSKTVMERYGRRNLGRSLGIEVPPCISGRVFDAHAGLTMFDGNNDPICFVYKGPNGWSFFIPEREEKSVAVKEQRKEAPVRREEATDSLPPARDGWEPSRDAWGNLMARKGTRLVKGPAARAVLGLTPMYKDLRVEVRSYVDERLTELKLIK